MLRAGCRATLATAACGLAAMGGFAAHAETEVELRTRVISALRLVEVKSPPAPASQYRADDDPSTIEIVYMPDKSDGQSRVSADGQVVYLSRYGLNSKIKEAFINKAFEIRFDLARASARVAAPN